MTASKELFGETVGQPDETEVAKSGFGVTDNTGAVLAGISGPLRMCLLLTAAFLTPGAAVCAKIVNCQHRLSDARLIQNAVRRGGTVNITGTCFMGAAISLTVAGTSIVGSGNPHLNFSGGDSFNVLADHVTITGITISGGSVEVPPCCGFPIISHFTFTNNTLQNVTAGQHAGITGEIWRYANISNNAFLNLWKGGFPTNQGSANYDTWLSGGVSVYGTIDQTTISNNSFNEIGNDAVDVSGQPQYGIPPGSSSNTVISYNQFANVHRANIEIQAVENNLVVKGNYVHDEAIPFWNSWGFSLAINGSQQVTFINNTGTVNSNSVGCQGFLPAFLEAGGSPYLVQGNVASTLPVLHGCGGQGPTWAGVAQGTGLPSHTNIYQNNVFCGSSHVVSIATEASGPFSQIVDRYNYKNAAACPARGSLTDPDIAIAFTSSNQHLTGRTSGVWSVYVVSNLSVKSVRFSLDGSSSKVVTQEIQDVNANFARDRRWLYHAALDTSGLVDGRHTINVTATDVSGKSESASQEFFIGSSLQPTALPVSAKQK